MNPSVLRISGRVLAVALSAVIFLGAGYGWAEGAAASCSHVDR